MQGPRATEPAVTEEEADHAGQSETRAAQGGTGPQKEAEGRPHSSGKKELTAFDIHCEGTIRFGKRLTQEDQQQASVVLHGATLCGPPGHHGRHPEPPPPAPIRFPGSPGELRFPCEAFHFKKRQPPLVTTRLQTLPPKTYGKG